MTRISWRRRFRSHLACVHHTREAFPQPDRNVGVSGIPRTRISWRPHSTVLLCYEAYKTQVFGMLCHARLAWYNQLSDISPLFGCGWEGGWHLLQFCVNFRESCLPWSAAIVLENNKHNNAPPHPRGPGPIWQTRGALVLEGGGSIYMPRVFPKPGSETGQDKGFAFRAPPPIARLFGRQRVCPSQGGGVAPVRGRSSPPHPRPPTSASWLVIAKLLNFLARPKRQECVAAG